MGKTKGIPVDDEKLSLIEKLCRSSIEAGIKRLCEVGTWPRPPAARRLRVGYDFGRNHLQDIQEVDNLLQYLASDDDIISIYSRQPSTPELYILYEYWEQLLLKILTQTEGLSPDNRVFHKWFKRFLKELYSDTARWRMVDTITGLILRGAELKFDHATVLTSTPAYDLEGIIWGQEQYIQDNWFAVGRDKATIITTVRIPKCQYAGSIRPYPHLTNHIGRHLAAIDAIRLTKPGVPCLHCFAEFQLSDFPVSTPLAYCNPEGGLGVYEKEAILDRSDFRNIRDLWRAMMDTTYKDALPRRSKSNAIDTAIARFNRTYKLQNWLDGIVDLTIALESLFGPKDNQELSYRISLRAGWLLNIDGRDNEASYKVNDVYERVRTMYDIRSLRVHAGIAKEKDIRKWVQTLSGVKYDESKHGGALYGGLLEVAIESARDIVRKAINACRKLSQLPIDGPHWPFPRNFDENIVIAGQRRVWQKAAGIRSNR